MVSRKRLKSVMSVLARRYKDKLRETLSHDSR